MPGDVGLAEAELLHQPGADGEAVLGGGGQRTDRAAELADEHARPAFGQALAMSVQLRGPDRHLIAKRDRQRVLAMGTAGHHGIPVANRQVEAALDELGQLGIDEIVDVLKYQHQAGVGDVLGGGAPVDVLAGVARACGRQRADDRHDRVQGVLNAFLDLIQVEVFGPCLFGNLLGGGFGNQAELGLGARQRGLEVEPLL